MEDLEFARTAWLKEEPQYAAFGAHLRERLHTIVRAAGIPASISARTKEIDSLLKKLILKPTYTYANLGDKLGARIIVKRLRDIATICDAIKAQFVCGLFENTADRLKEDKVGYLSVHVDVALLPTDPRIDEFPAADFCRSAGPHACAKPVVGNVA